MSGTLPIALQGTAVDPFKLPQQWNNILATQANTALARAQTATEAQRPDLVQAQTAQAGAQTGYIGAQTVGQQINNDLARLTNRARLGALVDATGQDQSSYSAPSGGGSSGGGSGPYADGTTGWDQLGGTSGTGTGEKVTATALGSSPANGAGSNALQLYANTSDDASGGAGGGDGALFHGVRIDGVSGPVPRQVIGSYNLGILKGSTGIEMAEQINKLRATRILQAATAGRVSPEAWNQQLQQLVQEGWMDPAHERPLLNRPELYENVVRMYASPDSLVSQQTASMDRGLRMTPTGPLPDQGALSTREWVTRSVPEIDQATGRPTGRYQEIKVPAGRAAQEALEATGGGQAVPATGAAPGGAPGAAAGGAAAAPPGALPFSEYMSRVKGAEVGGRAGQAAVNAASGATGDFQWMPGTWAAQVRKNEPALAQGKTDAELFAMLKTPAGQALEPEMMQSFTQQNAAALAAKDRPVNMSSLYLAHWFGPGGIEAIASQPSNKPLADVSIPGLSMDKVIAQNPVMRGKTVGQLVDYVRGRFGTDPVNLGGGGAGAGAAAQPISAPDILGGGPSAPPGGASAASPGGGAPVPVSAGTGASPTAAAPAAAIPPGAVLAGPPKLDPQAEKALEVQTAAQKAQQEEVAKAYGAQAGKVVENYNTAPITMERVDALQNAAEAFRSGYTGPTRAALASALTDAMQAVGWTPPKGLIEGATGAEVINKLGGFMAANMVKAMGEKAASVFDAVKSIQPNIAQTTGGFQAILSSIKMDAQRDQALGQFQEQWLADPQHGRSTEGMMTEFNKQHPIEQYASRVQPYPVPTLKSGALDESKLKDNVIYRNANGAFGLRLNGGWLPPVKAGDAHHFVGAGDHIVE